MNRPDPGTLAVKIANPKTLEFQVVRTSLLPGLLKTIRENRSHALPIRLFEVSDVVFKDPTEEKQSRNVRHAAALWCSKSASFEVVHGLLDRVMRMLEVPRIASTDRCSERGYYIMEGDGSFWMWFVRRARDRADQRFSCRSCILSRSRCRYLLPFTRIDIFGQARHRGERCDPAQLSSRYQDRHARRSAPYRSGKL